MLACCAKLKRQNADDIRATTCYVRHHIQQFQQPIAELQVNEQHHHGLSLCFSVDSRVADWLSSGLALDYLTASSAGKHGRPGHRKDGPGGDGGACWFT
jgi:hypothetical protein